MTMPNTRPLVAAAFICERVMQEKDGVFSAIRMVDTFYIPQRSSELPDKVRLALPLMALVGLKSGDVIGESEVELILRSPTGTMKSVGKWPIVLKGGGHGFNLTIKFELEVKDYGLYWFDLVWRGEVLTSMPLNLAQRPEEGRSEQSQPT